MHVELTFVLYLWYGEEREEIQPEYLSSDMLRIIDSVV